MGMGCDENLMIVHFDKAGWLRTVVCAGWLCEVVNHVNPLLISRRPGINSLDTSDRRAGVTNVRQNRSTWTLMSAKGSKR